MVFVAEKVSDGSFVPYVCINVKVVFVMNKRKVVTVMNVLDIRMGVRIFDTLIWWLKVNLVEEHDSADLRSKLINQNTLFHCKC